MEQVNEYRNQPSLFEDEDTDIFRISNEHAFGDYYFDKKTIMKDGKKVEVSAFTINSSKISDATIALLQKNYKEKYNYHQLKKKAKENLKDFFEDFKLFEVEGLNESKIKENKRIANIKIEREIKNIITRDVAGSCVVNVPFDLFMKSMQVDSFYRDSKQEQLKFGFSIQSVLDAQSNSFCSYSHNDVQYSEEIGALEVVTKTGRTALLPNVEFVLYENNDIKTIDDLLNSKKRKKARLIKYVSLRFDPASFAELVAPGANYTIGDRKIRKKFSTIYSHQLDLLLRSLERIQRYKYVNKYTFEDLLKRFGVNYKRYVDFKRHILVPALNDFNQSPDLRAEVVERFKSKGQLEYLYFKITRIDGKNLPNKDTFDLPYYIAVQHFYFNTFIEKKIIDFQDHYVDLISYTEDLDRNRDVVYCSDCKNDKSFGEWEDEYFEAVQAYEELSSYVKSDPEWFKQKGVRLCDQMLCLVNNETGLPYAAYDGQFILGNPTASLAYYKGV